MSDNTQNDVNLLDLFAFFVKWRKFLFGIIAGATIFAAIISFLLPPKYRSTAVIRSAEASSEGIGGLLVSKLAALGGIGGLGSSLGEIPGEFLVLILKSRWMTEQLIEEFDLRSVYKMKDQPIEEVIVAANARTRFELDAESQSVAVYAEDRDPARARAMADFLVEQTDRRHQELRSYSARREREFIGQRLEETQAHLTALEDSLVRFQEQTGVLDPVEQVKATVQAAAVLEGQRLTTQTELQFKRMVLGGESDEAHYLRLKLASIDSTIQTLTRAQSQTKDIAFLLNLADTPEKALTYLRLMRNIEIQQILVGFLLQRYEEARLEEHRNTPTIMRLDPAVQATKRVWPRRGLMTVVAALAALVFGSAFGMVVDFVKSASDNPANPNYDRIKKIRGSWSHR